MNIEEYKKRVVEEIMIKPASLEELKTEFNTNRLCWAFVMWTYNTLGIQIETEDQLNVLAGKFARVKKGVYKFPDIILLRHTKFHSLYLGRHAGIMLNNEEFVHVSEEAGGVNITSLKVWPWNCVPYMVIRGVDKKKNRKIPKSLNS